MRFEYFKLLHCRVPVALWSISVSLSETFKTPPLCFVTQNIGEVARSDGGVKFFKNLFGRFLTIHQEDRNTLIDKRFIAKIQVCLPTNYRLNHSFTHTFTSARFSKQIQRRKLLFQSERTSPYHIVIGKDIHAILPGI